MGGRDSKGLIVARANRTISGDGALHRDVKRIFLE